MKLDRNLTQDGKGKYALVRLRTIDIGNRNKVPTDALHTLDEWKKLDWGRVGEEDEFFVIKLKDRYAFDALAAYAKAAEADDPEYAEEIREMLPRAGVNSKYCKVPD
jgi:hypothetical protein